MPDKLVSEPPSSVHSGEPLHKSYKVQHRSDTLIQEQIDLVRDIQDSLTQAFTVLERAKSDTARGKHGKKVHLLIETSQQEVFKLQILDKINRELVHARSELDKSIHDYGNIGACRKRVMWLESRMEKIMGRYRLKNQSPMIWQRKSVFAENREELLSSVSMTQSTHEAGYISDYSMLLPSSSGIQRSYGDNDDEFGENTVTCLPIPEQMLASESRLEGGNRYTKLVQSADTVSDDAVVPDTASIPLYKLHEPYTQSKDTVTSEDNLCTSSRLPAFAQDDTMTSLYPSTISIQGVESSQETIFETTTDKWSESGLHTTQSQQALQHHRVSQSAPAEQGYWQKPIREDTDTVSIDQDKKAVEEVNDDDDDGTVTNELDSKTTVSIVATNDGSRPDTRSRVTIISPREEMPPRQISLERSVVLAEPVTEHKEEVSQDKGLEYWKSEHHRFAFSSFSQCEPLSYHKMGLAVPGSFVDKGESAVMELPWRQMRKGSDIQDIHKIALNKLAVRVHNLRDQVFDAAMLSVKDKNHSDEFALKESSFSQFGFNRDHSGTALEPGQSGSLLSLKPGGESQSTIHDSPRMLPRLPSRRLGTSDSGRMVYYPKPVPPPAKLPLTRLNRDKEYPKLPSSYVDTDNTSHRPAARIVDQRNLFEETKLSLYRDKPKACRDTLNSMERHWRSMLEHDSHMSGRSASLPQEEMKLKSHLNVAHAVSKMRTVGKWHALKPKSNSLDHSGLKWERVKGIVHTNIPSERVEERRDAAKHLGLLRCGDTMVVYSLQDRLNNDTDLQVRYEATKSLILIGCWENDVLESAIRFLVSGNSDIRRDLILAMTMGKNLQYINKSVPAFPELVSVLSHFCSCSELDENISFDAAILMGKMCIVDDNAKSYLQQILKESTDTHIRARALEVLVKQMNCTEWPLIQHILDLLQNSPVRKYRAMAASLLVLLGPKHVCPESEAEKVYELLAKRLWDDPSLDVRLSVGKAITALNMLAKASERVEKQLEDSNEKVRAQAVISLGTLGMKSERITRSLLEMLELDSSEYVRLMIVRTFSTLHITDRRVMRVLKEKERWDGPLAKEAKKAMKILVHPVAIIVN